MREQSIGSRVREMVHYKSLNFSEVDDIVKSTARTIKTSRAWGEDAEHWLFLQGIRAIAYAERHNIRSERVQESAEQINPGMPEHEFRQAIQNSGKGLFRVAIQKVFLEYADGDLLTDEAVRMDVQARGTVTLGIFYRLLAKAVGRRKVGEVLTLDKVEAIYDEACDLGGADPFKRYRGRGNGGSDNGGTFPKSAPKSPKSPKSGSKARKTRKSKKAKK